GRGAGEARADRRGDRRRRLDVAAVEHLGGDELLAGARPVDEETGMRHGEERARRQHEPRLLGLAELGDAALAGTVEPGLALELVVEHAVLEAALVEAE